MRQKSSDFLKSLPKEFVKCVLCGIRIGEGYTNRTAYKVGKYTLCDTHYEEACQRRGEKYIERQLNRFGRCYSEETKWSAKDKLVVDTLTARSEKTKEYRNDSKHI